MVGSSIITSVNVLAIWLLAKGNTLLLYAISVLFGIVISANISLIGPTVGQITSVEKFGTCYGMCYFCLSFLTILGLFFSFLVIGSGSVPDCKNFIYYEGSISIAAVVFWILAHHASVSSPQQSPDTKYFSCFLHATASIDSTVYYYASQTESRSRDNLFHANCMPRPTGLFF